MIDKDSDAYKAGERLGNFLANALQQALDTVAEDILVKALQMEPVVGNLHTFACVQPVDESNTVEGSLVPARQLAIEAPKEEKS